MKLVSLFYCSSSYYGSFFPASLHLIMHPPPSNTLHLVPPSFTFVSTPSHCNCFPSPLLNFSTLHFLSPTLHGWLCGWFSSPSLRWSLPYSLQLVVWLVFPAFTADGSSLLCCSLLCSMWRCADRTAAHLKQCMPVTIFVRRETALTPCHCDIWHQRTAIAIHEQLDPSTSAALWKAKRTNMSLDITCKDEFRV